MEPISDLSVLSGAVRSAKLALTSSVAADVGVGGGQAEARA